jgi:hypothetical protein
MAQTTADLLSLNLALGATAQRMNWAAQAIGIVGAAGDGRMYNQSTTSDFFYLDMQYQAYKEFANQYADKLALFADQIDMLLPLLEESSDVYMLAEEFQMTRDDLATNGFNEDERSYYLQTGLDEALISQLEGDLVASFDNQPLESMSFQEALTDIQASSRALATRLRNQYPVQVVSQQNTLQEPGLFVPPQVFTFEVGHPYSGQEMVELTVRPVSIPLGWTYELSANTFTLEENETAEATLTLYPDRNAIERDLVQITVEGTVDGDLVGGILMEYHAPSSAPFMNLYLPAIFK